MKLPKELTTVTKLSKYLAMVVFVALPIVGFLLGIRYQEMMDSTNIKRDLSCGGPSAIECPQGYTCENLGESLYAGGKCVKNQATTPPQETVYCTQDAKLCPDGKTYVSRQGPNCEFAECPTTSNSTCPTPPTCPIGKRLVYGDPLDSNQCAAYQCL